MIGLKTVFLNFLKKKRIFVFNQQKQSHQNCLLFYLRITTDTCFIYVSLLKHILISLNLHWEAVRNNWNYGVLLGDSGYPCRPFIMTPYLHPANDNQRSYRRHHSISRCVIECTFGRWKRRFHVLHSEVYFNQFF